MGFMFENEDSDILVMNPGLRFGDKVFFSSSSNWTFMKFTLFGLPCVRNLSNSLIEPIRKVFVSVAADMVVRTRASAMPPRTTPRR